MDLFYLIKTGKALNLNPLPLHVAFLWFQFQHYLHPKNFLHSDFRLNLAFFKHLFHACCMTHRSHSAEMFSSSVLLEDCKIWSTSLCLIRSKWTVFIWSDGNSLRLCTAADWCRRNGETDRQTDAHLAVLECRCPSSSCLDIQTNLKKKKIISSS